MKLHECRIGVVVYREVGPMSSRAIGHIVGLTINDMRETIAVVQWPNLNREPDPVTYTTYPIHPANLEILTDETEQP